MRPARFDGRDAAVVFGFLLFVGGIALLSVAWACVIGGGLVCLFGLVASARLGDGAASHTITAGDHHGRRQ